MKICRVSRLHPREDAPGSGLTPYQLSSYLPWESIYVTKRFDSPPLAFPAHVRPIFASYPEPTFPDGYNVNIFVSLLIYLGKLLGNIIFVAKVLRPILQFRPEIIHAHTLHSIAPALIGSWLTGSRLVLTFHGTEYYRFRKNPFLRALVRYFVNTVICIAPDMCDDLKSLMPNKSTHYFANGVDLAHFLPNPAVPKRKQIVFVGRLVWQKGLDSLLDAVVPVLREWPEYRLVLVGDGPLKEQLQSRVIEQGFADHIIFTGMLPQPKVISILQESEVFVLSSVSEGFPKALIEAMACGLPVVATSVGACKDVVQNAGIVVEPDDPEKLTAALKHIITDTAARHQYSMNALYHVQQYSWSNRAEKVARVYASLL